MIKRQFRFLLLLTLTPFVTFSQIQEEHAKHLRSIQEANYPINYGGIDSMSNGAIAFVEYTISYLLQKPSDKYFISNRALLEPMNPFSCDTTYVQMKDTLKNGKAVEISLSLGAFEQKNHVIRRSADSTLIYKIDDKIPYGAAFKMPRLEIRDLTIRINGKSLLIPKESYSNLYRPNLCALNNFFRGIEAYESLNGDYLYLYIFGGTVGDVWFAKLVFDHEKYITCILADYYVLNLHDSFKEDFIGF